MAIKREFQHDGHTLLYRISPMPGERLWAELRILREAKKLGDTIFAQPQLLSYKGPGVEPEIDKQMRVQADKQYGIKIPV
jgi:hypothetical protein